MALQTERKCRDTSRATLNYDLIGRKTTRRNTSVYIAFDGRMQRFDGVPNVVASEVRNLGYWRMQRRMMRRSCPFLLTPRILL